MVILADPLPRDGLPRCVCPEPVDGSTLTGGAGNIRFWLFHLSGAGLY